MAVEEKRLKKSKTPETSETIKTPEFLKISTENQKQKLAGKIFNIATIIAFVVPLIYNIFILISEYSYRAKHNGFTPNAAGNQTGNIWSFYGQKWAIGLVAFMLITLCAHFLYSDASRKRKTVCLVLLSITLVAGLMVMISLASLNAITHSNYPSASKARSALTFAIGAGICSVVSIISTMIIMRKNEKRNLLLLIGNIIYMILLPVVVFLLSNISTVILAVIMIVAFIIAMIKMVN